MRTTEKDLKKYFKRVVGCKVNDVILLRDRRNARNHKGCAYVEVGRVEDVAKALGVSGQPPNFQRFPILVKASEAEKNYIAPPATVDALAAATAAAAAAAAVAAANTVVLRDANGNPIESQKVYVGGLDHSVTEEHLRAIFSNFGTLHRVHLQKDASTGLGKGYAFLSFRDPKVSNLAIRTMGGQLLAGKPLKTGWANQQSAASLAAGCKIVTSEEFPENATQLTQKALLVLAQMNGGVPAAAVAVASLPVATTALADHELDKAMGLTKASPVAAAAVLPPLVAPLPAGSVAEARASLAAEVESRRLAAQATLFLGNADKPTRVLLVHNMYNASEETAENWQEEIRDEFAEEATKFGTIKDIKVLDQEPGGKIRVVFSTLEGANKCATNLAGRWFDQRQLRVDYLPEDQQETTEAAASS
jgi:RNA-binding protein 39